MHAIYTRLSAEDEDSNSIKNQRFEGQQFAQKNNIKKYKFYDEGEGISGGANIDDRPQLKQLISDINTGRITSVWCRNQNRLERSQITFHFFVEVVKRMNIDVYFGDKLADYNDASTYLQGSIISSINTYQRQLQGQQTKKALHNNVKMGKIQGMIPYGYMSDEDSNMIINPQESKVVKQIFDLSLSGLGLEKIKNILNDKNIPTRYNTYQEGTLKRFNKYSDNIRIVNKSDVKWSSASIRSIIKNQVYKGIRLYGGIAYESPIVIDPNYFDKVNANLKKNVRNSGRNTAHKYLLKGLIRCGKCERNFAGVIIKKKYHYYRCSSLRYAEINCGNKPIKLEALDTLIWTKFIGDGLLNELIKMHLKESEKDSLIQSTKKDIASLKTSKNGFKSRINRLIDLASDGVLTKKEINSKMEAFRSEIESIDIKLSNSEELLNQLSKNNNLNPTKDISYMSKSEVLKKYISNIIIEYLEPFYLVTIDFNIPLLPSITYALNDSYKFAHEYPPVNENMEAILLTDDKEINVKLLVDIKKDLE